MVGVAECDEGCDPGVLGDVEGLAQVFLVVVSYPACADSLEVGGYDHGLEGDDGVYEAVFFGDGVVGGVCADDGEWGFADVAVE